MKYQNPILTGFYPDPSVCFANGKYFMVCSSMHYFPGVPLFESYDLVNWQQIGHCLTRESQIELSNVDSSSGVFAPTIRYYDGVFYMTTTNAYTQENFYIWTDDIYSEWSEPIFVDQSGIDPSLYFEYGHAYFMSNGSDANGIGTIYQTEIDIKTGTKLSLTKSLWQGTGGRYLEGPHIYKINNQYYLVAAEGGTEYGHMVTYAKSCSLYGPYEPYPNNPVLTNRDLGGYIIQGVGHGELIKGPDGSYCMIHLGFRQTGQWTPFHHLGREVFITPIKFSKDGWFTAGESGTTAEFIELDYLNIPQKFKNLYTFENTNWDLDWCYLRYPERQNYICNKNALKLYGTEVSINDVNSPTFIGLRQKQFDMSVQCDIKINQGEAGISIFMDEMHHYDLAIVQTNGTYKIIQRLCIGNVKSIESTFDLTNSHSATLLIEADALTYHFYIIINKTKHNLGYGLSRYLSSEVATGFTGVIIGLYAFGKNEAEFNNFKCIYK